MIASNAVPWIGDEQEDGFCEEEVKMIKETRKILEQPNLEVDVTTVRIPVLNGHSEVICVECTQSATRQEFIKTLAKNTIVKERMTEAPDPLSVSGQAEVYVGRVRLPYGATSSSRVQFWNVADNLRKGAATNAVQIMCQLQRQRVFQ